MKTMSREVDARMLVLPMRLRAAFDAFDALAEGESLLFRTDADPRPVYDGFKARNPDTFSWTAVIEGPPVWDVEIRRLKPRESEDKVLVYFSRDHDEIDVLLGHLRSDLAYCIENPGTTLPLAGLFQEFDERLDRHIRWEEEVLFPAVEAKAHDLAGGPGRVMREEHARIQDLKAAAGALLCPGPPDLASLEKARRKLEEMLAILADHNLKEEAVYYPMSEELFSPSEAADILRRVREITREETA